MNKKKRVENIISREAIRPLLKVNGQIYLNLSNLLFFLVQ